ncbi:MAG TPA: aldehyde dehydrogenase family protein [Solirubrobacteraceae bacterium]|nr:aldehyde dehydrogenase family protein [Solirubrobacteraceae bacterium]
MAELRSTEGGTDLSPALLEEIDTALEALARGAERWAATSLAARADLLLRTQESVARHAGAWAQAAITAKGTPAALAGEEWLSGPYATIANLGVLAESLRVLGRGDSPAAALKARSAPDGRTALQVLPADAKEALLLHGFSAEVWSRPGISPEQMRRDAGLGAARSGENNGVGLVLGAGNISSIGPLDVLYELVAHNRSSLLKLNPTFASLRPAYEQAFAPLLEFGVLRIVNGGGDVGAHLTREERIVHVHITGSAVTHDLIVWGAGEEAGERRAAGTPKLEKAITSELGGVAPIIVVPGDWSEADLRFQAEHVATMRLHNGGHNCIAGQALILSADWPQREAFLAQLRAVLQELPARESWYPGTAAKVAQAEAAYPAAEHFNNVMLVDVSEGASPELFGTEYFGPVLGHTTLPGTGLDFLRSAISFANERLDGTLGANLLIEPRQKAAMGADFEAAIAQLRYGTIAVNAWTAFGFLAPGAPWGAFPGHTLEAVGSGIGVVHNAFLLDHIERTVVTGPFRPSPRSLLKGELAISPKPAWFVTARTGAETGRKLTEWAATRSWAALPSIVLSAVRA